VCPNKLVKPREWGVLRLWSAWRQLGGMPSPGSVEEQEARLVESFGLLDSEQDMIQAAHAEEAERRAKSRS